MKNQEEKFKKLKKLEKQGLELSSVWMFGNREQGYGSHIFHGNCIPQVVKQCVLRYSKKNDVVLDSMSGSGTTKDVCKELKRKCLAYDLNPKRNDIKKADAANLPVKNKSISMIFLHLPYLDMVRYSNKKQDLSNMKLDKFYMKLNNIFLESKRVLKNKGHVCVLIGDKIRDGKKIPLCFETYNILKSHFEYKDYAVKVTQNSKSFVNKSRVVLAETSWNNLLKPNHDILFVFQNKK